jgi:hypothetical protein
LKLEAAQATWKGAMPEPSYADLVILVRGGDHLTPELLEALGMSAWGAETLEDRLIADGVLEPDGRPVDPFPCMSCSTDLDDARVRVYALTRVSPAVPSHTNSACEDAC